MSRIKQQISVTVKTESGSEHRMVLDEVRSVGGAFLTAIGTYPDWAQVVMTIVKKPA